MIIRKRSSQFIPIIKCKTCGKIARQRSVIELEDSALSAEKRKTWNRIIKQSFNVYATDSGRVKRNKRIFYAAMLQECINKKHKLQVVHLNGLKFRASFADIMKEDEDE